MSTAQERLILPNVGFRSHWKHIGAGCVVGTLTVGAQTVALGDAPIHVAPSLLAIAFATVYWGYRSGFATMLTSAILINYALLSPRCDWSSSTDALTPAIHASTRSLIDLAGNWDGQHSALHRAIASIVAPDGIPYETKRHPLVQAARGSVMYGEHIGRLSSSGKVTPASLYAATFADGRILAMAIVDAASDTAADSSRK